VGVTSVAAVPQIDFLGIFPTLETLLAQGVLVACVLYGVMVALRRSGSTARPPSRRSVWLPAAPDMRLARTLLLLLLAVDPAVAQEGQFLSEAEAPKAVFPDADAIVRTDIEVTPALRDKVSERLSGVHVSVWESHWIVFRAERAAALLGHAVVVEEIGKHRPITFVVGLRPDGRVADVAVMAYREAYGGEIRSARFLAQYHDKRRKTACAPTTTSVTSPVPPSPSRRRAARSRRHRPSRRHSVSRREPDERSRCSSACRAAVAQAEAVTELHYVMGTYYRITAEGHDVVPVLRGCFQDARRLEHVYSRFEADSELSRVNATAGAPPSRERGVRAPPAALDRARHRHRRGVRRHGRASDGALAKRRREADRGGGRRAQVRVGSAHIRLDGRRLELPNGHRLDFDGIAKGWAVDGCVARLAAAGIGRALVSLGESSVYALGVPAGEDAWALEVRGVEPDEAVGVLRLRDDGAVGLGDLRRLGRAGRVVGHVVDPRTGEALAEPAVAVVVSASATDAEAFSKALLLWGRRRRRIASRPSARAARCTWGVCVAGACDRARRLFDAFAAPSPLSAVVARP
jgi:thiamine biosynthesis lipoprotein ApbE